MALTATTLASSKAASSLFIRLTSAAGALPKMLAMVDGEWMRITSVLNSPTIGVVPGYNGTPAGPHGQLAPVVFGPAGDFVAAGIVPGGATASFGADGPITGITPGSVPVNNMTIYLTKATAGAYTLAAPAIDQTNTLTFISTTAAAHLITFTPGFYGNGTASDVATFPATVNGVFTVRAQNGSWAPVATADDGVVIG